MDTSIILKWLQDEYDGGYNFYSWFRTRWRGWTCTQAKPIVCGIKPENVYILDVKGWIDYVSQCLLSLMGWVSLGTIGKTTDCKKLVEIANGKRCTSCISRSKLEKEMTKLDLNLSLSFKSRFGGNCTLWEGVKPKRTSILEYAKTWNWNLSKACWWKRKPNKHVQYISRWMQTLHISLMKDSFRKSSRLNLWRDNGYGQHLLQKSSWLVLKLLKLSTKMVDPIALNGEKLPANLISL